MIGKDGQVSKTIIKVTWEEFQEWQRWDEFPERKEDPPMTVDMTFIYRDEVFYLDTINHMYAIFTEEWEIVSIDANFLKLLKTPIESWGGKTFCELIGDMLFVN